MSALLNPVQPILLEDFVNNLLQTAESLQIRNLHCQTSGSEVVLRGCVSSFDAKLLAHNMVKSACGMRDITNEVLVQPEVLV